MHYKIIQKEPQTATKFKLTALGRRILPSDSLQIVLQKGTPQRKRQAQLISIEICWPKLVVSDIWPNHGQTSQPFHILMREKKKQKKKKKLLDLHRKTMTSLSARQLFRFLSQLFVQVFDLDRVAKIGNTSVHGAPIFGSGHIFSWSLNHDFRST